MRIILLLGIILLPNKSTQGLVLMPKSIRDGKCNLLVQTLSRGPLKFVCVYPVSIFDFDFMTPFILDYFALLKFKNTFSRMSEE